MVKSIIYQTLQAVNFCHQHKVSGFYGYSMFSEEGNFENHDIFFTARCENVYIADCPIVGNVLANTDNREIW